MTVGSALSLSRLSLPPLKHSDSNWSLSAEFDFPHFVSEDGDWRDFGFLLENSNTESDAEPDLPDGIEPAGPEDPPCNEEVSGNEYELGMYAPKPLFGYDFDDVKNAENLDLQGILYDDILDDDDYLPQADEERLKEDYLAENGDLDEIFIPKLYEEHDNNKDNRISCLYEPLCIEIPETAEPEEKAPMLCLADLRKRARLMEKDVEEKKTKLANHNDPEKKPKKDAPTEVEVPLVKRLRPRPARPTPMDLEVIRRDENGEITKKRMSQIGSLKAEPAQVVNPAEISLGGEVHDWTKDEKPSEMVTTKNLIKDEDDRGSIRSGRSGRFGGSNSVVLRRKNSSMASNQGSTSHPGWISPRKQKIDNSADEAQPTVGILMHVPPITPTRGRGRPRKSEMEKKKREELQRERILAEGTTANQTTLDPSQLHCVCRTPYDEKKFYVACNICSRWFHGKCVGISEKKAKRLSSFTCEVCVDRKMDVEDDKIDVETASSPTSEGPLHEKEEPEEELYCLCRTPYNDTLFYVGCDGCEGWFHPKCVDITQEEAEMAAQYLCPSCTQNAHENDDNDGYESAASSTNSDAHNTLSRADYPLVWSLLEMISEHRLAWPFKDPVDTVQFPTYLNVIKHPIDLSIIQNKLENLEYRRLRDFARDMLTMLDNARTFNIKGSEIYKCADTLEGVFRLNLADVKANIESRNKMGRRKVSESNTVDSSMDIDTDQLIDVDIDPSLFDQFL